MGSSPEVSTFASHSEMVNHVANAIESALIARIDGVGCARFAVSGGSTPLTLYQELAQRDLPWSEVQLMLVDERWVPVNHSRSNEAFVQNAFEKADDLSIQGLFSANKTPHEAARALNKKYRDGDCSSFDIVVLGMGNDGHAASWFPHAEGLNHALETDDVVCAIKAKQSDVTGDEVDRITLTLSAVESASLVVLLLAGKAKWNTLQQALEPGLVEDMPVRAILRARPDIKICFAP